jgi:putative transposase
VDRLRPDLHRWNIGFISGKIVRLLMSERMTKDLVILALESAYLNVGKPTGVILHSDRGSQYYSTDYQNLIKKYGFM